MNIRGDFFVRKKEKRKKTVISQPMPRSDFPLGDAQSTSFVSTPSQGPRWNATVGLHLTLASYASFVCVIPFSLLLKSTLENDEDMFERRRVFTLTYSDD